MIAKSSGSAATNIPMVDGEGALTLHSVSTGVETGDPTAMLDALRKAERCDVPLTEPCRELMRAARLSGASWDQIGDAVGLTGAQARSRFVRSSAAASISSGNSADNLVDDELMELAVTESKAARRQRANR